MNLHTNDVASHKKLPFHEWHSESTAAREKPASGTNQALEAPDGRNSFSGTHSIDNARVRIAEAIHRLRRSHAVRRLIGEKAEPALEFHYHDPLIGRAARRDRSRFIRRAREKGIAYFQKFGTLAKFVALVVCASLIGDLILPVVQLAAQPTFDDYDQSQSDVQTYVDRASRLQDKDAWNNYVNLGVATELVEWEQDAEEEMRAYFRELSNDTDLTDDEREALEDDSYARYEAARLQWEADAEEAIFDERIDFLTEQANVSVTEITDAEYASILAEAQAAVMSEVELNLELWDQTVQAAHAEFKQRLEDEITGRIDAARDDFSLTPEEQAAFDAALDEYGDEIRAEMQLRDNFYLLSGRNNYISMKRADDISARLVAESESADAIGDALLEETTESVNAETEQLLDEADDSLDQITTDPDADLSVKDLTGDWETKMEGIIDAGLHRWERAEEDLYRRRLQWMEDTKRSRAEAETVWQSNHEKLKQAREEWLEDVKNQITDGREVWEAKLAEFQESKRQAELDLQRYVNEERGRRDATLQQLGDMIRGGGSALGEAKEAYFYYNSLMSTLSPPPLGCGFTQTRDEELYCFYQQQRDIMGASMGRFQAILGGAETTLDDNMHSNDGSTGMLTDVRAHAGDLPEQIAALDEDDFENELRDHMVAQSEDYVLYQRDIYDLIDQNRLFVERTEELDDTGVDFQAPDTIEELVGLIDALDERYEDHRIELRKILNQDRSELPDDAAKLAAAKDDIAAWLSDSQETNARLKREVTEYFNIGGDGFYVTADENDPYLMTQAEFEWELLRRERNYLAKRLRRAEEVKRYADLAAQHEAGLEMASITDERAEVARIKSDLAELAYLVIKGDIVVDPAADTDPAVLDSEFARILAQRGLDPAFIAARETRLDDEQAITTALAGETDLPDQATIGLYVNRIDEFLATYISEDVQTEHRLHAARSKLVDFAGRLAAGEEDVPTLTTRWNTIIGAVAALDGELNALVQEYEFAKLRDDFDALKATLTGPTIRDRQANLEVIRADIEANAEELRGATERLEEAKTQYRNARIDFDIINASNSADLIRIDITNTTKQLASVLNRMTEIEDIPGMEGRIADVVSQKRIEYLYDISEGRRAQEDLAYTEDVLRDVQGLEEAKKRLAVLEEIIGAGDVNALDPGARASAFIDRESELAVSAVGSEHLASFAAVNQALTTLNGARDERTQLLEDLDQAIADGEEANEIAILRTRLARTGERIDASIETLIGAVRGEENARRLHVLHVLDMDAQDTEAIAEQLTEESEAYTDDAYLLGEEAATLLRSFVEANREESFADLIELANQEVASRRPAIRTNLDGHFLEDNASRAYDQWKIVRDWIYKNKAAIEHANRTPEDDDSDRRGPTEKWDSLLGMLADLEEDSSYYREYRDALPDSADDPEIVAYRSEREGLVGRLATTLATGDAGLLSAYQALSPADRDILISYGWIDTASTTELRHTLNRTRRELELELAALEANYKEIYLRERMIELENDLIEIEKDYNRSEERYRMDRSEKSQLARDVLAIEDQIAAETDPGVVAQLEARRDDIEARIDELETRISDGAPAREALRDAYRQATNLLAEMQREGSTAPLVGDALSRATPGSVGLGNVSWLVSQVEREKLKDQARETLLMPGLDGEEIAVTPEEQLKAIIGVFATDANGDILRNADGTPLISDEFDALGVTDPDQPLMEVIGGDRTGPELETWSNRLLDYLKDPQNQGQISPEVAAAGEEIQEALRLLQTARAMIENRDRTKADILTEANIREEEVTVLQRKLNALARFEAELAQAVGQATQSGASPIEAALSVIEKKEHQHVFRLFAGFDESGDPDGYRDDDVQQRVDQLVLLAQRLRESRRERAVLQVTDAYEQRLAAYLDDFAFNPAFAGDAPELDYWLSGRQTLRAQPVRDTISAFADDGLRDRLWQWTTETTPEQYLYRGAVIEVLTSGNLDGADLRSEVDAALNAMETDLEDSVRALIGDAFDRTIRVRDTEVTDSVVDLIQAYASRATDAKTKVAAEIASIDPAADIATVRGDLKARLKDDVISEDIYRDYRFALNKIIDDAGDTPTMIANINDYLSGLSDPEAGVIEELDETLYDRELEVALTLADVSDAYNEEDYPAELREVILIRAFQNGEELYNEYLEAKNSDVPSIADAASLDLRGLMGDVSRRILINDFNAFQSELDYAAFLAEGEGRRGYADYIEEYFLARNTTPGQLPGVEVIYERLAVLEYQRMSAAATGAGGVANLNEADYAGEFQDYITLAQIEDYLSDNGLTISGATIEDRSASFRTHYEAYLDDTASMRDGKTLRQRLLASDVIDAVFHMSFAYFEEAPPLEKYLPLDLEERRLAGTLEDPPRAADDFLPEELTAIAGYEAADYRDMLRTIAPEYHEAIARLETGDVMGAWLSTGRLNAALMIEESELDRIIAAAGYAGDMDPAVETALRGELRAKIRATYIGSGGIDERTLARQLRSDAAFDLFYADEVARRGLEEFTRAEGDHAAEIENKFFTQLVAKDDRLRELAKEERGDFLRAIIERGTGSPSAYYGALDAELQTEFDALVDALYVDADGLSDEEKDSLINNTEAYARYFDMKSAQELVTSGIFESLDAIVTAGAYRNLDDAQLAVVRENRAGYLKALVELLRADREDLATAGDVTAFLSAESLSTPGLNASIMESMRLAALDSAPELSDLVTEESVLVDRFLDQFLEEDTTRSELLELIVDPALTDPHAKYYIGYDLQLRVAEYASFEQELAQSVSITAGDQLRFLGERSEDYIEQLETARALKDFAKLRDDDLAASRFSNYRTYIGVEATYLENSYDNYEVSALLDGVTPVSREEYHQGLVLRAENLGLDASTLFDDANWEANLRSDSADNVESVQLGTSTATTDDDRTVEIKTVYRVSNPGSRSASGDPQAELAYTYYEHLANNYLEAISNLNSALNMAAIGSEMATAREAQKPQESLVEQLGDYDPNAATNDLTEFQTARDSAVSRAAQYNETTLQQKKQAIDDVVNAFDDAAEEYADAARRNQVRSIVMVSYLNDIYRAVATEMDAAQADVDRLSTIAAQQNAEYAAANQRYVATMNEMGERIRNFEYANDEYEQRAAVRDWAETPYLYTQSADAESAALDDHAADALDEYERARAALQQADEQLADAGYQIQVQDSMDEFNAILTALDAGDDFAPLTTEELEELIELEDRKFGEYETLTAEEETRLEELRLRNMYERYADLIEARGEHIKHSMRMVRLHKANEIINAEILRLRGVVDQKKRAYDRELDFRFSMNSNEAADIDARNAVYQRLAALVEGGAPDFFNEFRAWFWGGGQWTSSYSETVMWAAATGGMAVATPSQFVEAAIGYGMAGGISGGDQSAVGRFLAAGGQIAELSGFTGTYFQYLMSLMAFDQATLKYAITMAVYAPSLATAVAMYGSGTSLVSQGQAMLFFGAPLILTGLGLIASAVPLMRTAQVKIAQAQLELMMTQIFAVLMFGNAVGSAGTGSTRAVMEKQAEYEDAKANLEYFTKADDLQTMKERLVQWGAQHGDNDSAEALYKLTDEDLKYLFERNGGDIHNVTSGGATQTLTAEEQDEALETSGYKYDATYQDAFGRYYDPDSIIYFQPAGLENGTYGGYTRIRVMNHNGSTQFAYARIVNDPQENDVYNLGEVLNYAVTHGSALRNQRRDAYYAEGNAAANASGDSQFVLNERDQTFSDLFELAGGHAEGGREYTGYRMVYEEYEQNQRAVFDAELAQRQQKQLKEWELKEAELQERYDAWETRMATVLERGQEAWSGAEAKYLQAMRDWEREFEREEEAKEAEWDAKVREQQTAKEEWETNIRQTATEATINTVLSNAIDQLNSQITSAAQDLEIDLSPINKQAALNAAIQKSRDDQPKLTERIKNINQSVKDFKARVSISEIQGTNTLAGTAIVGNDFRNEMNRHQKNMRVKANVEIFEQYRQLIEEFKWQIDVQNEKVEAQTTAAALAQGFVRYGNQFMRVSGAGGITPHFVDTYLWYDVDENVDSALKESGFSNLENDELFAFLQEKDTVEVESYFYTQKLAAQAVFEKILGTGNEYERKYSKDENVIGSFGMWVGRKPGQTPDGAISNEDLQRIKRAYPSVDGITAIDGKLSGLDVFEYGVFGGFGELGELGMRPGGAMLGFYPQLAVASRMMQAAEQEKLEEAGELDPVSATWAAFDPGTIMTNAYHDVQIGKQLHGKNEGYMWEAQAIAATENAVQGAATALSSIPLTAWLAPLWQGIAALYTNSVHVNTQTGERHTKMTDEALIRSATSAITAYVPAGAEASAAQQAAASALQTITAGLTFSQKGHFTGWDAGQAALGGTIGLIGSQVGAAAGGQAQLAGAGKFATGFIGSMAGGVTSHFLGATSAYFGNGDYSGYNNPGFSGLGVMANALAAGYGATVQQPSLSKGAFDPGTKGSFDPVAGTNFFGGLAEAFRRGTKKAVGYAAQAAGYINPFGQGGFVRNALGSALGSMGFERASNWALHGAYETDKVLGASRNVKTSFAEKARMWTERGNLLYGKYKAHYNAGENWRGIEKQMVGEGYGNGVTAAYRQAVRQHRLAMQQHGFQTRDMERAQFQTIQDAIGSLSDRTDSRWYDALLFWKSAEELAKERHADYYNDLDATFGQDGAARQRYLQEEHGGFIDNFDSQRFQQIGRLEMAFRALKQWGGHSQFAQVRSEHRSFLSQLGGTMAVQFGMSPLMATDMAHIPFEERFRDSSWKQSARDLINERLSPEEAAIFFREYFHTREAEALDGFMAGAANATHEVGESFETLVNILGASGAWAFNDQTWSNTFQNWQASINARQGLRAQQQLNARLGNLGNASAAQAAATFFGQQAGYANGHMAGTAGLFVAETLAFAGVGKLASMGLRVAGTTVRAATSTATRGATRLAMATSHTARAARAGYGMARWGQTLRLGSDVGLRTRMAFRAGGAMGKMRNGASRLMAAVQPWARANQVQINRIMANAGMDGMTNMVVDTQRGMLTDDYTAGHSLALGALTSIGGDVGMAAFGGNAWGRRMFFNGAGAATTHLATQTAIYGVDNMTRDRIASSVIAGGVNALSAGTSFEVEHYLRRKWGAGRFALVPSDVVGYAGADVAFGVWAAPTIVSHIRDW